MQKPPDWTDKPEPISGPHEPPPRFAGPTGGTYRKGARALYVVPVTPPRGSLLGVARAVVRVALRSWPTPSLLGSFVTLVHAEGDRTAAQLARRYRCSPRQVKRWFRSGGPLKRSTAARVIFHAFQLTTPRSDMMEIPAHVLRRLRVATSKAGVSTSKAAAQVAREVAAMEAVQMEDIRGACRCAPLPAVRQRIMVKAAALGATVTEIADVINRDPSYVSRQLARVGGDA